ncbi:MAG: hypothetical protein AAF743_08640 [Planctomycetota bacterium]
MSRLLLLCILVAGCADADGTKSVPQRQSGESALSDPFGYGPNIEQIAAEKQAERAADIEGGLPAGDPDNDTLADEWKRFWNP